MFLSNSNWDASFNCIAYDYHADWDDLHDHLRDVPWEDIFNPIQDGGQEGLPTSFFPVTFTK